MSTPSPRCRLSVAGCRASDAGPAQPDNGQRTTDNRFTRQLEFGTYAFWLVLMALLLLGTACGPKAYPSSRPKYGCRLSVAGCLAADHNAGQQTTDNRQP